MRTTTISPHEIDTPWPSQEIAWIDGDAHAQRANMRRQIAAGLTHLVREVRPLYHGEPTPETTEGVEDILSRVGYEFLIMGRNKIKVPDVRWHSFRDDEDRLRTLARVGIIDGLNLKDLETTPDEPMYGLTYAQARTRIRDYRDSPFPGMRLADTYASEQYMLGEPRDGTEEPGLFYIDPEPFF